MAFVRGRALGSARGGLVDSTGFAPRLVTRSGQLAIEDFNKLRRDFKKLDATFDKRLKDLHLDIGQEVVARVKANAPRVRARTWKGTALPSKVYGRLAKTARAGRATKGAKVSVGRNRGPNFYLIGYEFGSKGGKRKRQFPRWRGNQWPSDWVPPEGPGYLVYPTIAKMGPRIRSVYSEGFNELARSIIGDQL